MKRSSGIHAPYSMLRLIATSEEPRLQFARQLYDRCLERFGLEHEGTRLVAQYMSDLEYRNLGNAVSCPRSPMRSHLPNTLFARETTFVPLRSTIV
jgi:hypothetical protein